MNKVAGLYTQKKADYALSQKQICFFAGGVGNPLFTTDTAAVIRAVELKADIVMKGTKVDGIFTSDPAKNKSAKFIKNISFDEVLARKLNVMDMTAFTLARDHNINIVTFNLTKKGNIKKALIAGSIGSLIHN